MAIDGVWLLHKGAFLESVTCDLDQSTHDLEKLISSWPKCRQ